MNDTEINIALAKAIGWTHAKDFSFGVMVRMDDGRGWRVFNFRVPEVIWPIAVKYDVFPYKNHTNNKWTADYSKGWYDTPEIAVAMAVIQGAGR